MPPSRVRQRQELIRCRRSRHRRPDREHQRYRLRQQAAPMIRGLGPRPWSSDCASSTMHSIGRLRGLSHEAGHRGANDEPVGAIAGGSPNATLSATLRLAATEAAKHRRTQLVQPGEGELHLPLDAWRTRATANRTPWSACRAAPSPIPLPHHQDGTRPSASAMSCPRISSSSVLPKSPGGDACHTDDPE